MKNTQGFVLGTCGHDVWKRGRHVFVPFQFQPSVSEMNSDREKALELVTKPFLFSNRAQHRTE